MIEIVSFVTFFTGHATASHMLQTMVTLKYLLLCSAEEEKNHTGLEQLEGE